MQETRVTQGNLIETLKSRTFFLFPLFESIEFPLRSFFMYVQYTIRQKISTSAKTCLLKAFLF